MPENTLIEYTYRDASNYHVSALVVIRGAVRDEQLAQIKAATRHEEASTDLGDFIPGLIGMKDLQNSFEVDSYWNPEQDHPMHSLDQVKPTDLTPTIDMDIDDFTKRMVEATWDLDYTPPFYEEMADRWDAHVEASAATPNGGPWGGM